MQGAWDVGLFMTQVEHDISDFEEAGEAVPGVVPERQWHHHIEDDELCKGRQKNLKGLSRSSPPPGRCKSPLPTGTSEMPFPGLFLEFRLSRMELASFLHKSSHELA